MSASLSWFPILIFAAVVCAPACGGDDVNENASNTDVGYDAGPLSVCRGISIEEDGVLDLELKGVQITGSITLEGAPLPSETGPRGTVTFVEEEYGARVSLDLGRSGAKDYKLHIPPGAYQVEFDGNPALCRGSSTGLMPCLDAIIVKHVVLDDSGVLDIDLKAEPAMVRVSGSLTLNEGVLPPATSSRGTVEFRHQEGLWQASVELNSVGPVEYELALVPGVYDLVFDGNETLCLAETAPAFPCNLGVLRGGVQLQQSGVLDVDIPAVTVTGSVTLEGAVLPGSKVERGNVVWSRLDEGGGDVALPLPASAMYEVTVLPGDYAVSYSGDVCESGSRDLPCGEQVLRCD